jgi:hypothetical protein
MPTHKKIKAGDLPPFNGDIADFTHGWIRNEDERQTARAAIVKPWQGLMGVNLGYLVGTIYTMELRDQGKDDPSAQDLMKLINRGVPGALNIYDCLKYGVAADQITNRCNWYGPGKREDHLTKIYPCELRPWLERPELQAYVALARKIALEGDTVDSNRFRQWRAEQIAAACGGAHLDIIYICNDRNYAPRWYIGMSETQGIKRPKQHKKYKLDIVGAAWVPKNFAPSIEQGIREHFTAVVESMQPGLLIKPSRKKRITGLFDAPPRLDVIATLRAYLDAHHRHVRFLTWENLTAGQTFSVELEDEEQLLLL